MLMHEKTCVITIVDIMFAIKSMLQFQAWVWSS